MPASACEATPAAGRQGRRAGRRQACTRRCRLRCTLSVLPDPARLPATNPPTTALPTWARVQAVVVQIGISRMRKTIEGHRQPGRLNGLGQVVDERDQGGLPALEAKRGPCHADGRWRGWRPWARAGAVRGMHLALKLAVGPGRGRLMHPETGGVLKYCWEAVSPPPLTKDVVSGSSSGVVVAVDGCDEVNHGAGGTRALQGLSGGSNECRRRAGARARLRWAGAASPLALPPGC